MSWARIAARIESRLSEVERRLENSTRKGKIAEVDEAKGLARMEVGVDSDGTPQLGPWVKVAQMAGALKVHAPATVGQTYMQIAPGGDFEQAFLIPLGWSDENPNPGNSANPAMTFGSLRIDVEGDTLKVSVPKVLLECGGATFELTSDGLSLKANLAVEGDAMTHNEKNVGSTHVHGGVSKGGALTDPPA